MADYAGYAKRYGDLMADYNKVWKGKISLEQYGKMHYSAHGKKEGRKIPGGSTTKSTAAPTNNREYGVEVKGSRGRSGSKAPIISANVNAQTFNWDPAGSDTGGVSTPNAVRYSMISGSESSGKAKMFLGGETVYGTFKDGRFTNDFYNAQIPIGVVVDIRRNEAEQTQQVIKDTRSAVKATQAKIGGSDYTDKGETSSKAVNAGIRTVDDAMAYYEAKLEEAATGYATQLSEYETNFATELAKRDTEFKTALDEAKEEARLRQWPGTPTWVQTFADYRKWVRMRSKEKGYESTIMTSSTGLTEEEMTTGLKVTSLSG